MNWHKQIHLIKNNDKRDWTDIQWMDEFFKFLQGKVPKGISLAKDYKIKLSPQKAMIIIWYLQEHFSILPDNIEMCCDCKCLYDSLREGFHSDKKGKGWCNSCDPGDDE